MALSELSSFNNYPQRVQDLINGFMREAQSIFPIENTYHTIPISINLICGLLYHLRDEWNKYTLPSKYTLSDDRTTLKCADRNLGQNSQLFYLKEQPKANIIGDL